MTARANNDKTMKAIATDSSPCRHRRWQKDGEEKLKKTFKGLMLPDFMSNQGIIRKLSVEKMCYNPSLIAVAKLQCVFMCLLQLLNTLKAFPHLLHL